MIKERVFIVHTSYATFAIITDFYSLDIKAAAPIAKWAIGKNVIDVIRYFINEKQAQVQMLFINVPIQ